MVSLYGCMAKPAQPPLTLNESIYFKQLSKECSCKVDREIDPRPDESKSYPPEKSYYTIIFDDISIQYLDKNIDSLRASSLRIAKTLENEILTNDFKYNYDSISVIYDAHISDFTSRSESFTFGKSQLK